MVACVAASIVRLCVLVQLQRCATRVFGASLGGRVGGGGGGGIGGGVGGQMRGRVVVGGGGSSAAAGSSGMRLRISAPSSQSRPPRLSSQRYLSSLRDPTCRQVSHCHFLPFFTPLFLYITLFFLVNFTIAANEVAA